MGSPHVLETGVIASVRGQWILGGHEIDSVGFKYFSIDFLRNARSRH